MNCCEDFPCCGHELNDCPNPDGSFNCVECGDNLPRNARSSICDRCRSEWMLDDEEREHRMEMQDRYDEMWG